MVLSNFSSLSLYTYPADDCPDFQETLSLPHEQSIRRVGCNTRVSEAALLKNIHGEKYILEEHRGDATARSESSTAVLL